MFADCGGFTDVLKYTRDIPMANQDPLYTKLSVLGFTDEEIKRHKKAYQFLRLALNKEVDRDILLHVHSPTEAYRKA